MKKTTIILNAPPHSGKDTIADLFVKDLAANKQEFKAALYKETANYYHVDLEDFTALAKDRKLKDNTDSLFSGVFNISPRDALIHVSEDVIKPLYGLSYFGHRAAEALTEGLNVFSDGGGWWEELTPVIEASDRVVVCRLYRHGYTFKGDSRNYYDDATLPKPLKHKVTICDIHLEENKPQAAVDAIKNLISTRK